MNRQDDTSLVGTLVVFRRIPPFAERVQWPPEGGEPSPSSQNFGDKDNELSVYLESESSPEIALQGHEGFGLVQLTIQDFRDVYAEYGKPLVICRDDEDPANGHVLICGKATPAIKAKLKARAKWVPERWPAKLS